MTHLLHELIDRWRTDQGGTYRTWFLWGERLKNFRSIRRGLEIVVAQIEDGSFGTSYKGSSLETVVRSIVEQRQLFKGADHPFLWKPKLRIPDIYENRENQLALGRFLSRCVCCSSEEHVLQAIRRLDEHRIKGLGPAVANLIYFLHPTIALPFNTAIVRGYNALTGSKVKLGQWNQYLAMREGAIRLNAEHRKLLSNDLGAIAGLLFDIGTDRYAAPPIDADSSARAQWEADLSRVRELSAQDRQADEKERAGDRTHTEIQGWLRDLGFALGYDVWIAANDLSRCIGAGVLGDGCLDSLPQALSSAEGADAVRLIDVLWLDPHDKTVSAAFEVEHSTSIYSGIVRLLDLALSSGSGAVQGLFLVAPDSREDEVRAQLRRPAFRRVANLNVRYLPYGELERHRESIGRFGAGLKAMNAIAKTLI